VLPACRSFGWRRSRNSWERLGGRVLCSRACVIQSDRSRQHYKLRWRGGYVLECFRLAGALDCVGAGTRRSGWEGVFPSVRHPKRSQAQAPARQTWVTGRLYFGVLPACRSFGTRRSGNSWERLGGRVPEHASSKAVASAQAPALQTWVTGRLCFGVLPACRSFGWRRSGNSWDRPNALLYSVPYREFSFGGL